MSVRNVDSGLLLFRVFLLSPQLGGRRLLRLGACKWIPFDATEPLFEHAAACLIARVSCAQHILVFLRYVEVDMEVGRVLQRDGVVEDHCEEDNQHKEPVAVYSILVGAHEICAQVHRLHIKEGQGVQAGDSNLPEVVKFVAPHLPDDHRHQEEKSKVGQNQIDEVWCGDRNNLEK